MWNSPVPITLLIDNYSHCSFEDRRRLAGSLQLSAMRGHSFFFGTGVVNEMLNWNLHEKTNDCRAFFRLLVEMSIPVDFPILHWLMEFANVLVDKVQS